MKIFEDIKIRKFTLAVLCILMAALQIAEAQDKFENQLVDAVQYYSDGNYQKALSLLSEITRKDKDNDAAWYYKSLCEMYLNRPAIAQSDIKKAIAIDSGNFWYRETLARIYAATGQKELTIAEHEKLIKDFPKKNEIYYSLVNLYLSENRLDDALQTIEEIETVAGKSDPTVMTKYRILLQQNKQEEAHKSLKAYNEEYSSPQVLVMLGDHEMGMYNDSSALAYYDEALSLDRDFTPALLGKAEAYRLTRKYPDFFSIIQGIMRDDEIIGDAKAKYLMAITQNSDQRFISSFKKDLDSTFSITIAHHPKDSSVLEAAGIYYLRTQREDLAEKMLEKNMINHPGSKEAAAGYLQMLLHIKKWEKLVAEAEKAHERFSNEDSFLLIANAGHYNLKNYNSIINNCEKIIASSPQDTSKTLPAYSTIGDMYHLKGETKKAYKAYEKALKINPEYAPVLNNYAYYLSEEGKKLQKAYRMSKKTIELHPDNATYLDTFGWILHLLKRDLEAKPFFKHAMLYGGKDNPVILEHYAAVLERLGEDDLAKVYRSQAKSKAAEASANE